MLRILIILSLLITSPALAQYIAPSGGGSSGSGTVTSLSVVSGNGFAGTVATATTTPAITLTTTVTGNVCSNATALSACSTTGTGATVLAASPTLTGVPVIPTPFTLGAVSVTSTGTQLNYLSAATGTTGTTSTNVVFSTSPTLVAPALGTPISGVATNLTGTASGLTAGNVTTNANLTGVITSVGNATSIASQTGTGTKFVVDTSPTLVTPALGVATATSLALNSATIGTNALAVTGTAAISGKATALNMRVTASNTISTVDIGTSDTQGIYWDSANVATFVNLSTAIISFGNSVNRHIVIPSNSYYSFSSTTTSLGSEDTVLSRNAAGVVQFGTTAANASGAWLAAKGTLTGGTLADQANVLAITATQPASPSAQQTAIAWTLTSAGSSIQSNRGLFLAYAAGYTGSGQTVGMQSNNSAAGTGTSLIGSAGTNNFDGNAGFAGNTNPTTTGTNVGNYGFAQGGNINVGLLGQAQVLKNSATNIGVVGSAINTGTSPVQIGGFFSLNQTTVPTVNAALIADNGSQTDAIFLARDNGSTVFTIADGGQVTNAAGTITTSQPFTITQTWNAAGVTFNPLLINVTATASAAASLLADFQVAGVSKFNVSKAGDLTLTSDLSVVNVFGSGFRAYQTGGGGVGFQVGNAGVYAWGSGASPSTGQNDTMLSRNAAGIVQIGTSAANASGSLLVAAVTASGITTISNATDSTTTTTGALQVAGGMAVRKRIFADGLTTSAGLQTAVICQSSAGELIADSVACLASSERFKTILGSAETGALAKIARLPIHRWKYNEEGLFKSDEWTRERIGPTAEDTAAIDPRLVGYGSDGQIRNISTEQLLALTIQALQELKADNDNLRATLIRHAN